MSQIAVQMTVI